MGSRRQRNQYRSSCTHSTPVQLSGRTSDVVVSRDVGDKTNKNSVEFALVVECKRSIDKPWVALSSPVPDIQFLRHPFPSFLSQDADHAATFDGEASLPSTLMPRHGRIGHGIVAAFAERGANAPMSPYSAVRGVADATFALDRKRADLSLFGGTDYSSISVLAPLIVLDGRLFECFLDDAADMLVEERSCVTLLHPDDPPGQLDVTIVSMAGLPDFVKDLSAEVEVYLHALLPHASRVIENYRDRMERLGNRLR